MGNLVAVDASANAANAASSVRLDELILAASDLDWNYFEQVGPQVRTMAQGVTLYASSADKAMALSRTLARIPRAGDIINGEPIIIPGIESIDVTAIGEELFGLNHDVFAASRSAIDDLGLIIRQHLHPPLNRLPEILGFQLELPNQGSGNTLTEIAFHG